MADRTAGEVALVTKERAPSFVRVREDWAPSVVAHSPVADAHFMGMVFPVWCCTVKDLAELRDHYGKDPIGADWRVQAHGSLEEMQYAFWVATGRDKSPLSMEEMGNMPWAFEVVMREVLTVFFWVGPLIDPEMAEPTNNGQGSTERAGSSTPASGTQEPAPAT